MSGKYDGIINLPHHVSNTRPKMPLINRAAQFSPFAALTGYEDAIDETGRLTGEKVELSEEIKTFLNEKINQIQENLGDLPMVGITYFVADIKKTGGTYIEVSGAVKKVDEIEKTIILKDGTIIPIDDILEISL